jgi:hypothetical protein
MEKYDRAEMEDQRASQCSRHDMATMTRVGWLPDQQKTDDAEGEAEELQAACPALRCCEELTKACRVH